jgi:hypothetical protein
MNVGGALRAAIFLDYASGRRWDSVSYIFIDRGPELQHENAHAKSL